MKSFNQSSKRAQRKWAMLGGLLVIILAACSGGNSQPGNIGSVNGEPITRELFEAEWLLPKLVSEARGEVPAVIPKQEILDELVNSLLMAQSAREAGFTVSDQEVQEDLALFLADLGTTKEEFEARLLENGVPWGTLEEIVRRNLLVYKYQNETILARVPESDRQDILNAWLDVLHGQASIEFDPDFLDEIRNE